MGKEMTSRERVYATLPNAVDVINLLEEYNLRNKVKVMFGGGTGHAGICRSNRS